MGGLGACGTDRGFEGIGLRACWTDRVDIVGPGLGTCWTDTEGFEVGSELAGLTEGFEVGSELAGLTEGFEVGSELAGLTEGFEVGSELAGLTEGFEVGSELAGLTEGFEVGWLAGLTEDLRWARACWTDGGIGGLGACGTDRV